MDIKKLKSELNEAFNKGQEKPPSIKFSDPDHPWNKKSKISVDVTETGDVCVVSLSGDNLFSGNSINLLKFKKWAEANGNYSHSAEDKTVTATIDIGEADLTYDV